jgi:predicted TIM-barrel fold metal-dependent hydrolase
LDLESNSIFDHCAQVERLEREMGRLRAALDWYANSANYKAKLSDPVSSSGQHRASPVERDYGETARKALTAAIGTTDGL